MSSPESGPVYSDRSNSEALLEKRKQYVYEAIDSTLLKSPRDFLWQCSLGEFIEKVQSELLKESQLNNQITLSESEKKMQDVGKEFNYEDIKTLIFDFFSFPKDINEKTLNDTLVLASDLRMKGEDPRQAMERRLGGAKI